jgi:hypothetical protein
MRKLTVTVLALVLSCCGGSGVELDKSEPWDMVFIGDVSSRIWSNPTP